jgi:hypothetical protein
MGCSSQSSHRVVGYELGDLVRSVRTVRAKPGRGPVEGTQKGARSDCRVAAAELAPPHSLSDERTDSALVPIAFGDDERTEFWRQRVDLEVCRRTLYFVDEAEDMGNGETPKPAGERPLARRSIVECGEQAIERAVLTEVQQLLFAAEVVVQVGRGEIGRDGDLAHAGGGKTALAKRLCRRAQDFEAPVIGAPADPDRARHTCRTAVR